MRDPGRSQSERVATSDVVVVKPNEVAEALERHPEHRVLAEVLSPFSRAIEFAVPLSRMLREHPEDGQAELGRLTDVARSDIETAILAGAHGIFYILRGADPSHSTPMEYGGLYLQKDRQLLDEVADAPCNVLYVDSGQEAYLDFLADLPVKYVLTRHLHLDSRPLVISADELRPAQTSPLGADQQPA